MSKDMTITVTNNVGTTVLPLYSTLQEQVAPIESENVTLDGSMYTDFTANRRAWLVGFDKIKAADYETMRELYNQQYASESIPVVTIEEYGITAPMKLSISDRNIRMNGEIIEGFTLTLKEQYAVS